MNRGADETRRALKDRGMSINQGAILVGADSGTFSKILREKDGRKPGRALAATIFAKLGVNPSLWEDELPADETADAEHRSDTDPTDASL
jgi:transcriptional regulator with XRE-family HTH domain